MKSQFESTLLDAAIEQIKRDIVAGDETAIYELLTFIPMERLQSFIEEN